MSYIDTFDHEFVGYFGHRPVYHPLETVPATPGYPADFACGPQNLVIGGGAGEYPGLVISDLDAIVEIFFRDWLTANREDVQIDDHSFQQAADTWLEQAAPSPTAPSPHDLFHFAGWSPDDHARFESWVQSAAFACPYRPEFFSTIETWLACSIGEFVLLAMPELAPAAVTRIGRLCNRIGPRLLGNLLILPPGYPAWGRREVDGKVEWNQSAWKTIRQNYPETIRR